MEATCSSETSIFNWLQDITDRIHYNIQTYFRIYLVYLFNDAVGTCDYKASNGSMFNYLRTMLMNVVVA
jgi:hypothetical protein